MRHNGRSPPLPTYLGPGNKVRAPVVSLWQGQVTSPRAQVDFEVSVGVFLVLDIAQDDDGSARFSWLRCLYLSWKGRSGRVGDQDVSFNRGW